MDASHPTEAELFFSFSQAHSLEWHRRRHALCQAFLDIYVRRVSCHTSPNFDIGSTNKKKDEADLGDIECNTSYRLVHQPRVQWAVYQELQQRLAATDFQTLMNRRSSSADADEQDELALEGCKDVREALIGIASYSRWLQAEDKKGRTPCQIVVDNCKKQGSDLEATIRRAMREAELLERHKVGECPAFQQWKAQVRRNHYGDLAATPTLQRLISEAIDESSDADWTLFYRDPSTSAKSQEDKLQRPSLAGKGASGRYGHLSPTVSALRTVTTPLSGLAEIYVNHMRSLRFSEAVLAGQNNVPLACAIAMPPTYTVPSSDCSPSAAISSAIRNAPPSKKRTILAQSARSGIPSTRTS